MTDEIKVNQEGLSPDEEQADGAGLLCTEALRLEQKGDKIMLLIAKGDEGVIVFGSIFGY